LYYVPFIFLYCIIIVLLFLYCIMFHFYFLLYYYCIIILVLYYVPFLELIKYCIMFHFYFCISLLNLNIESLHYSSTLKTAHRQMDGQNWLHRELNKWLGKSFNVTLQIRKSHLVCSEQHLLWIPQSTFPFWRHLHPNSGRVWHIQFHLHHDSTHTYTQVHQSQLLGNKRTH
jgi:hypothetical protein